MTRGTRPNPLWRLLLHPPETDDCIEWSHSRVAGYKYGRVQYEGTVQLTHRVSFLLHKGPIPNGLDVCHSCDNPPCWNPRHLFAGTRRDNVQDCIDKNRFRKPPGRRALTDEQVRAIRSEYQRGKRGSGARIIGAKYGVLPSTILNIVRGISWKELL